MAFQKSITLSLFAILLSGCATNNVPPPAQAVLSIDNKTCDNSISAKDAISLIPAKPAYSNFVNIQIDEKKPCINIGDKKANYTIIKLPDFPDNHTISVGGVQEAFRIFAPLVFLLDKDLNITREFSNDKYVTLGNRFGVLLRPANNDQYILVRSNPDVVGVKKTVLETRINQSTGYSYNAYTGYGGSYTTLHGKEGQTERVFSHEGEINITIQALKGKIGLPDAK